MVLLKNSMPTQNKRFGMRVSAIVNRIKKNFKPHVPITSLCGFLFSGRFSQDLGHEQQIEKLFVKSQNETNSLCNRGNKSKNIKKYFFVKQKTFDRKIIKSFIFMLFWRIFRTDTTSKNYYSSFLMQKVNPF